MDILCTNVIKMYSGNYFIYCRVHQAKEVYVEMLELLDQSGPLVTRVSEEEMESRVTRDIQVPVVKKDHQ